MLLTTIHRTPLFIPHCAYILHLQNAGCGVETAMPLEHSQQNAAEHFLIGGEDGYLTY